MYATIKPAGATAWGFSNAADKGNALVTGNTEQGAYKETINHTTYDSGDYLVCAWLQDSGSQPTATVATRLGISVRVPHSTAAVQVPAQATAGTPIQIAASIQTEVSRRVYVVVNAPGIPCGANYAADQDLSAIFSGENNTGGPNVLTANYTPPRTAGVYTVCGWIQESGSDTVPESTFTGQFNVTVPPTAECVAARNSVTRLTKAVTAYKAAYTKWSKKAKTVHGKKHRSYARKATAYRRKWKTAKTDLANAQHDVATECAV
jgi:hypothetical protein